MDGHTYTNSQEGLEDCIKNGKNLIELDFLFSSDGEIFCSHQLENIKGFSMKNRPTIAQVESLKVYGYLTPITLPYLFEKLHQNSSMRIVFDSKEEDTLKIVSKLVHDAEDAGIDAKSRFVMQVYSLENYEDLQQFGFVEYWYTNYKKVYTTAKIEEYFGNKANVSTIVLYWTNYLSTRLSPSTLSKKIAVHTIDDNHTIEFLKRCGVSYIFTNRTDV